MDMLSLPDYNLISKIPDLNLNSLNTNHRSTSQLEQHNNRFRLGTDGSVDFNSKRQFSNTHGNLTTKTTIYDLKKKTYLQAAAATAHRPNSPPDDNWTVVNNRRNMRTPTQSSLWATFPLKRATKIFGVRCEDTLILTNSLPRLQETKTTIDLLFCN